MKRVRLPQGNITRMSVALLVDHAVRWDGTGENAERILEPQSEQKLEVIHDLVAGAIGLNTGRGDQLTVESLPFESTLNWTPPEERQPEAPASTIPLPAWLENALKNKNILLIAAAGAAAVIILLVLGVFLLMRKRGKKTKMTAVSTEKALPSANRGAAALDEGDSVGGKFQERITEQAALTAMLENQALQALKVPNVNTKKAEVLTKHITEGAEKDPAAMAQLLRTWLNEEN